MKEGVIIHNLINDIVWSEKSEEIKTILNQTDSLMIHPLPSGLEAEVMKISTMDRSFVLKIWNKSSRPDVGIQYRLLKILCDRGVPVSVPYGWGVIGKADFVLLTSYNGTPIHKVNQKKLVDIASILWNIHHIPVHDIGDALPATYDFTRYFFPRINEFDDIRDTVSRILDANPVERTAIIHGDYNLGNILEQDGSYTIIDWTNGQLGDPRYDVAWASTLLNIFLGSRYSQMFLTAYLAKSNYRREELIPFETLACLRWILLDRLNYLPKFEEKIKKRIRSVMSSNPLMKNRIMS